RNLRLPQHRPARRERPAKEATMNWKLFGLWVVLADFAAFTAYAVWHHGYFGLIDQALANAATVQVSIDLVIALTIVTVWMVRDARGRGLAVAPFVVATALLGSIGPLLYLIRREYAALRQTPAMAASGRHAVARPAARRTSTAPRPPP